MALININSILVFWLISVRYLISIQPCSKQCSACFGWFDSRWPEDKREPDEGSTLTSCHSFLHHLQFIYTRPVNFSPIPLRIILTWQLSLSRNVPASRLEGFLYKGNKPGLHFLFKVKKSSHYQGTGCQFGRKGRKPVMHSNTKVPKLQ